MFIKGQRRVMAGTIHMELLILMIPILNFPQKNMFCALVTGSKQMLLILNDESISK